ncbi:MAG TPA: hypothetical protein VMW12_05220 [Candidatus Dormibacteraeota bacterium]|nr:hypothetical protein [Candidatus Dormibacteraeota bacterium]
MSAEFTHFLRIGIHSEAEIFQKARPLYDALIFNANLVEATPGACAALAYRLGKPFLIDPFTHAFSLNPKYLMSKSKGKTQQVRVKRSFAGLAGRYFSSAPFLGERALAEADVSVDEFTLRVLDYQKTILTGPGEELVNMANADPAVFVPKWLLAPYFPLRKSMSWLEINLKCLESALKSDAQCAGVIAVELSALRNDAWKVVADRYCALKPKTLFLWIESFDEDQAEEADLKLYCDLVRYLSDQGVAVVNLFGGFFSCLAQCIGLTGFAHGLVYGENKSFTPVVGGGQPPPRYYMKPAHVSMNVRGAELVLGGLSASAYLANVCDCVICSGLFDDEQDVTRFAQFAEASDQGKFMPRAYALCRYHFLFARHDEISKMQSLTPGERIESLVKNIEFLQGIDAEESVEHLLTWIKVIKTVCS